MIDLRRLALSVQLGGTETFLDDESRDLVGFILLHGLQQPLITLTPVLTLGGGENRSSPCTAPKETDTTHISQHTTEGMGC